MSRTRSLREVPQLHIFDGDFQSCSSQAIRLGSRCHFPDRRPPLSSGLAFASASRLASRSMARYLTSQWAMVLKSTPERNRWTAVVTHLFTGKALFSFRVSK